MKQVPMLNLKLEYEYMREDIDSAIRKCLEHQKWILGSEVKELEEKIAEYLCIKHCIGICSGTDALVLSLRALAIKSRGQEYFERTDEIITTPFTFAATGDAILRSGATPVFVDIDPNTFNIDIDIIKNYLTISSKVIGIIPVHLYGLACNMGKIMEIAEEHGIFVVEDAAQAFGGEWKGKKLGTIGTTGAFSFFPSKNLGGYGDSGAVTTNDDEIAEIVRMLIRHGGKDKYNVVHIGYNARLDTLQAAIILSKLKYIDEFNEKRRKVAEIYTKGLSGIDGIVLPIHDSINQLPDGHVFHQYTIRVLNGKRDELQNHLKEKEISTMVYYPFPLHKMRVFRDGGSKTHASLENAELTPKNVLSLPIGPLQSVEDTSYVMYCVREHFENCK